jgi:hypothetical protein
MSLKKLLESLDQIGQASPTSAPTNSVDQLHQQLAEQWSEFDDDDEASDDQDFYVAIANDDGSAFVGRLTQRDGRWREEAVAGLVPDGWGDGRYMSYLRANDLMSWLQRDYSEVRGPFDSADQATSWAEQNYGDINDSEPGVAEGTEGKDPIWNKGTPMPKDYTCPCGIYVHPSVAKPGAIHDEDCPYAEQQGVAEAISSTAATSMYAATRKRDPRRKSPQHNIKVGDNVTTKDGKSGEVVFVDGEKVHVKGTNIYYPNRVTQYSGSELKKSVAEQNYGDINESAKVNTATLNDDDWYVVNTKTGEILSRRGPQGGTLAQQQAAEAGGDVQALKGLHIKTRHRNLLNMQEARGQMNYEPKVSEWAVIPNSKKQFVSRFSTRQQAEAHAQQHGGRVTALDQMGRIIKMREARPDFLDLDGDGDTSEPMKKAAADKKRAEQTGQSVLNELTQGQSYTQKQLMDKIRSGDWEATYDIKPGRHVEMRHQSGRRVTVHVKNQTKLGEYTVNEISWADSLGELNMSAQEIIEKSQSDGTISQRQVMKFDKGNTSLYFFEDDGRLDALVLLDGDQLRAIKNFTQEKGLVFALMNHIVNIKNNKLRIDANKPMTKEGFKWVAALIEQPSGLKVRDQNGQEITVDQLKAEWERSKSTGGQESGPTELVIGESSQSWSRKLKANQQRMMPYNYFKVTGQSVNEDNQTPATDQYESADDEDHPMFSAMVRRVSARHPDLLRNYGTEFVLQAISDMTSSLGELDEIGSSDVSIMIDRLREYLSNVYQDRIDEVGATAATPSTGGTGGNEAGTSTADIKTALSRVKAATGADIKVDQAAQGLAKTSQGQPASGASAQALAPVTDLVGRAITQPNTRDQMLNLLKKLS